MYKSTSLEIDNRLVGSISSNGIKVTGKSFHFISRIIGSKEQRRNGVLISDAIEAIIKPVKLDPIVSNVNGRSQRFIGEKVVVTINPDTGNLIQANPR